LSTEPIPALAVTNSIDSESSLDDDDIIDDIALAVINFTPKWQSTIALSPPHAVREVWTRLQATIPPQEHRVALLYSRRIYSPVTVSKQHVFS